MRCFATLSCLVLSLSVAGFSGIRPLPTYIEDGRMQWDRFAASSTYQEWTFDNNQNAAASDYYYNPYATPGDAGDKGPFCDIQGVDGSIPFGWYASAQEREGVWAGDPVEFLIQIPNTPDANPIKYVWFEMIYAGVFMLPVGVTAENDSIINTAYYDDDTLENGWHRVTACFTIEDNPSMEWVTFALEGTGGFVDYIAIDTLCTIPEPATLSILGIGIAAMFARKRHA